MDITAIDNFWSNPNLNFQQALQELEKTHSEYLTSKGIIQNDQQTKELLRELIIRLSAVTQKSYIEELKKLSQNIESMEFAEGANYLKALQEKGSILESIIESIEKKPEEELYFLQQFQVSNAIAVSISFSQLSNAQTSSTRGGCYIATMAYGNYEHPQVIVLRNFRDKSLSKSKLGLWLISRYYYYSPNLVDRLKNKKRINCIIRKCLDLFIKIIR